MKHAPTAKESSGSYPALLMSVFYSASWHVSSFSSFLCACVSLFSWCSQPLLCCQQRRGRITTTARRSCSPLCIAGTHCKLLIGHLNPTLKGCDGFFLLLWCSLPDRPHWNCCVLLGQSSVCVIWILIQLPHLSDHGNVCSEE